MCGRSVEWARLLGYASQQEVKKRESCQRNYFCINAKVRARVRACMCVWGISYCDQTDKFQLAMYYMFDTSSKNKNNTTETKMCNNSNNTHQTLWTTAIRTPGYSRYQASLYTWKANVVSMLIRFVMDKVPLWEVPFPALSFHLPVLFYQCWMITLTF